MLGRVSIAMMLIASVLVALPSASATSGDDCPQAWTSWAGGLDPRDPEPPQMDPNVEGCAPLTGEIDDCTCLATCPDGLVQRSVRNSLEKAGNTLAYAQGKL